MTEANQIEDILLDPDAKLLWEHRSGQSLFRAYSDSQSLHLIQGELQSNGIRDCRTSICEFDTIASLFVDEEFSAAVEADIMTIRRQLSSQLGQHFQVYKTCTFGTESIAVVVPESDGDPHELAICLIQGEGAGRTAVVATTIHRSLISAAFSEQHRPSGLSM